eukprot:COSAG05_NODE_6126_length_1018_cov_0.776931_1_plen_22_part_10
MHKIGKYSFMIVQYTYSDIYIY